jgi:DNA-binding NarL/FixJ family response regulator
MIVEDNKLNMLAMKLRLEQIALFHLIGEACDGQQAVTRSEELRPDVILMDVGLPVLNGIEACRQIKGKMLGSRVIMLTFNEEPRTIEACLAAGADSYCSKDIDNDALIKAIQQAASLDD